MKNLLIVGQNSYVGNAFERFAKDSFHIKTICVLGDDWRAADFSGIDCILQCAGIAHKKSDAETYFKVNCDLAVAVAEKAKSAGVAQFIYISSAAVYGKQAGSFNAETTPKPDGPYGASKLKAENELKKYADDRFKLTIVRPPMVYGPDRKSVV